MAQAHVEILRHEGFIYFFCNYQIQQRCNFLPGQAPNVDFSSPAASCGEGRYNSINLSPGPRQSPFQNNLDIFKKTRPTTQFHTFESPYEGPNMSNIDSHVASVLDAAHSDDEDALIASLEDSPALDAFREQRIQQLHSEFTRAKSQKNQGFGNYIEIKEEKALMDLTTEVKYAVVHFAKDDFARCGVMDDHLRVEYPSLKYLF